MSLRPRQRSKHEGLEKAERIRAGSPDDLVLSARELSRRSGSKWCTTRSFEDGGMENVALEADWMNKSISQRLHCHKFRNLLQILCASDVYESCPRPGSLG